MRGIAGTQRGTEQRLCRDGQRSTQARKPSCNTTWWAASTATRTSAATAPGGDEADFEGRASARTRSTARHSWARSTDRFGRNGTRSCNPQRNSMDATHWPGQIGHR